MKINRSAGCSSWVFALGACAALLAARDPRIVAAANLDGETYGKTPGDRVNVPLLFLVSEGNAVLAKKAYAPGEADYLAVVKGVSHPFFTDLLYLCRDVKQLICPADTACASAAEQLAGLVRCFFDVYVKQCAEKDLLSGMLKQPLFDSVSQ